MQRGYILAVGSFDIVNHFTKHTHGQNADAEVVLLRDGVTEQLIELGHVLGKGLAG